MIRKIKYTILALLGFVALRAQTNLVPNPSFEEHYSFPPDSHYIPLSNCYDWYSPTGGTPDYYSTFLDDNSPVSIPNNSAGYQNTFDGNFYAGIFVFDKTNSSIVEYLQVRLIEPLQPQKKYRLEFYVSLADSISWYAMNNIGGLFTENPIDVPQFMRLSMYTPQIINSGVTKPLDNRDEWIKIDGEFIANGGEEYLTIGNFNLPENDDTLYSPGGHLGTNIKPSYLYLDFVSVVLADQVGIHEELMPLVKLYPNPAQDFVSIELPKNISKAQLSIYNLTGQLISQKQITQPNQNIPLSELDNGMYIFVIQNEEKVIGRQRVVVAR